MKEEDERTTYATMSLAPTLTEIDGSMHIRKPGSKKT